MPSYYIEGDDGALADLILRSFRDREILCGLVLATYRVELTAMLSRMATAGFDEGDVDCVAVLAEKIASIARAGDLSSVHRDALRLKARAEVAQSGSEEGEGQVLVLGLKVIDGILDAGRERGLEPAYGTPLN